MKRRILALAVAVAAMCRIGVAQSPAAPALSEGALQMLRSLAQMEMPEPLALDQRIVGLFGLGGDNEQVPSVRLTWLRPEGRQFIYFSLKDGADDVVLAALKPGITRLYLTNSARVLRAAGEMGPTTQRLITVAEAAEGFQIALKTWAEDPAALK